RTDKFNFKSQSKVFEKIMVHYGINKDKLYNEFKLRAMLLMKLYQQRIFDFKEVQKTIHEYYKSPEDVLKRFKII
ncbi:MAG: secretion system protein E, partial [Nanoarchaeota archaeon]|nr:secretion system protein E [Nanoarchaeota archaeon]